MVLFVLIASAAGAFLALQDRYSCDVEAELRKGLFQDTASIFVNSRTLVLGTRASAAETADDLRRAGFTESRENPIGWSESTGEAIVIRAGSPAESTMLRFAANKVDQILTLPDNSTLGEY